MAQTIIITGASSGIGAATAEKFLKEGWNVAMLARRLEKLDVISSKYENAVSVVCDVTKEETV